MDLPKPSADSPIAAQWRAHVDARPRSGLSARAFAERHDLNAGTLYCWRRRFRLASPVQSSAAPTLVPVMLEAPSLCELVLRDGRVLRFPPSLPPATLRAWLAALESA